MMQETGIYLPPELIRQIFSCLPAKSVGRFKCVSKFWREELEDRDFVQMHSSQFRDKQRSAENSEEEFFGYFCILDGLILETRNSRSEYRIKNPLTKQVLVLPSPLKKHVFMRMFYSPAVKKYKLFYIYEKEGTKVRGCQCLTLDTDLNWRNVEVPRLQEGTCKNTNTVHVNGVYFMLKEDSREIVCFEITSENSSVVESIPQDCIISGAESISTISCNDKFAIAKVDHIVGGEWKVDIWVLKDYKGKKWDESKISIRLPFMTRYLPDATHMSVLGLAGQRLFFSVNYGQRHVVCNTLDTNTEPYITDSPPEQRLLSNFHPSVARLQGMKAGENHNETADYRIRDLAINE